MYVLREVGLILDRYIPENLKNATQFPTIFFSRNSKSNLLYSFSLDVPLIASVLADAALYWLEPSFW